MLNLPQALQRSRLQLFQPTQTLALNSGFRDGPARMAEGKGGDLFIVDNSISGWSGLEYLKQWTEIASAFDIATGFFEIGAMLALDLLHWQHCLF